MDRKCFPFLNLNRAKEGGRDSTYQLLAKVDGGVLVDGLPPLGGRKSKGIAAATLRPAPFSMPPGSTRSGKNSSIKLKKNSLI
jgi:hypothetical protein